MVSKAPASARDNPESLGTNYVFNEKIEKDLIIGSSPTFGEMLKKNSPVNLLISKGSDLIDVGAYAGKSSEQALTELNDAGFDVTVKEKFSETVKAGNVISREPQELKMARGAKITLTVSKGSEFVLIPTGLLKTDQQSATKNLENAGFVVKAIVPFLIPAVHAILHFRPLQFH